MPSTVAKELVAYIMNGLSAFQYGLLIKSKSILLMVLNVSSAFYALIRRRGVITFYDPVFLLLRHLISRAFYVHFSIVT